MLINSYLKKEENQMGFGDFIRGTISCLQVGQEQNIKVDADLGHLQKFFKPGPGGVPSVKHVQNFRNKGPYSEFKSRLRLYVRTSWEQYNQTNYGIFTNTWPRDSVTNADKRIIGWGEIDPEIKQFIRERLQPSECLLKDYNDHGENYEVLHIRTGDPNAFNITGPDGAVASMDAVIGYLLRILPDIYKKGTKLVILSDNIQELKTRLAWFFDYSLIDLTFSENEASHTGIDSGVGTMHDLLTLVRAAHIHQASVYHWNSGFSNIAHNIFDVPTTTYPQII